MNREAIILAGGLGTRLKKISGELPKPMVPIAGKPFLHYILTYLKHFGFNHIVLSVGYRHETIVDLFGQEFLGMKLDYAIEEEPLGTGGAIVFASGLCREEQVFILNGDTYFEADPDKLGHFHREKASSLSLCLKELENTERYGTVMMEKNLVVSFTGRGSGLGGLINGGVYLLDKSLLDEHKWPEKFSFELDLLTLLAGQRRIHGMVSPGYFIDIGIPEDYEKAREELPARLSRPGE